MKRSIVVDTAHSAITEIVDMVEAYASVNESIEVVQLLAAARTRLDRIQAHPNGRPMT